VINSWTVPPEKAAIRLDAFVRRCLPHLSAREAQRAIAERAFWVNGRPGKKGVRLFAGDVVFYKGAPHLLAPAPPPAPELPIRVLYEDDCVVVVDKPAGLPTHGFSGRERRSLANFLIAAHPALAAVGTSRWEPGLLHRLDRGTSGLVLAAKDQDSFEALRLQFRKGLVEKKYWALVWGKVTRERLLSYPLAHDPRNRKKMITLKRGRGKTIGEKMWPASTRLKALASAQRFTLLDVDISTGVTHQIRAHLQAFGHPLVGDPLYGGDRPCPFGLRRQFLHAYCLRFRQPRSGKEVVVKSPLPGELRRVLEHLGIKQPCP
jgi:23S rRNA pseudouridine1911/1915/1917 synthase